MSRPHTVEDRHLRAAESVLARHCQEVRGADRDEARLQILEASASRIGGFSVADYFALRGTIPLGGLKVEAAARDLVAAVSKTPLPPAVALAALARPVQHVVDQKRAGAWYTDWRLARFLVASLTLNGASLPRVLDPACGSATLLVAAVLHFAGADRDLRSRLLAEHVFGTDLDPRAIRGACLALASLTNNLDVVRSLTSHLRVADALVASEETWADLFGGPARFDIVVGNPPWERLRVTRHEHHALNGVETHYGDLLPEDDALSSSLGAAKQDLSSYIGRLRGLYEFQGTADPDLYKLFTELAVRLLADGGQLAWLLPGGIIRSQGTAEIRRWLMDRCSDLRFTVLSNLARFFAVDSRQKVVLVEAVVGGGERHPLRVRHADGTADGVAAAPAVVMGRTALLTLRADLSLPEVRSTNEWNLYLRLAKTGKTLANWQPAFCREVDMSLDKKHFASGPGPGLLPLVEGRMVHQHRHDAKRYVSGTGRAARWDAVPSEAECEPRPQFWFPERELKGEALARSRRSRVGFCDITGQTNERGMLAARIPVGFVCGNKVPTIVFEGCDDEGVAGDAFLAIANSFTFDWLLRRMVTTTVNFFLLRDMPWSAIDPNGLPARRLAELSRRVGSCRHHSHGESLDTWGLADERAEIEFLVADLWGLDFESLKLILEDFPLLDRAFPALPGEQACTVTKDAVLLRFAERKALPVADDLRRRVSEAKRVGAVPFIPSHLAVDEVHTDEAVQQ